MTQIIFATELVVFIQKKHHYDTFLFSTRDERKEWNYSMWPYPTAALRQNFFLFIFKIAKLAYFLEIYMHGRFVGQINVMV